jgi:thymidylate synthase
MNNLDKEYQMLLEYILGNGVEKKDRTGTGTKSIFGWQIRHNMSEGFPLLTTKKMAWKQIVTELLWFLRGDTNIKYLVDNNCHIWDGDAYKYFKSTFSQMEGIQSSLPSQEEFINKIKTDDEYAKKWGELGPVYGKQWRSWTGKNLSAKGSLSASTTFGSIDQIANLIQDLKTNPDSRRLMVNAWNVGEVSLMVLPPCHYGFQVYTRELSLEERRELVGNKTLFLLGSEEDSYDEANIPRRAISLMWNQRSVDTFLGLPFNIASYGLLLEIIAKEVNMIPDELIGNLGDVHLYNNHIEQAKEQIGRELSLEERIELASKDPVFDPGDFGVGEQVTDEHCHEICDSYSVPRKTREPYKLPKLNINTEWWDKPFYEAVKSDAFCRCLLEEDIQLYDYQSHPTIKAPLSN